MWLKYNGGSLLNLVTGTRLMVIPDWENEKENQHFLVHTTPVKVKSSNVDEHIVEHIHAGTKEECEQALASIEASLSYMVIPFTPPANAEEPVVDDDPNHHMIPEDEELILEGADPDLGW